MKSISQHNVPLRVFVKENFWYIYIEVFQKFVTNNNLLTKNSGTVFDIDCYKFLSNKYQKQPKEHFHSCDPEIVLFFDISCSFKQPWQIW